MAKLKLTKGELKRQRDGLAQFERYLPTLQLKKQQLQIEIMRQDLLRNEKTKRFEQKKSAALVWAGLLKETSLDLRQFLSHRQVITEARNVAGIDLAVFVRVDFSLPEYDLFMAPFWVDAVLEFLKELASLQEEVKIIESGMGILRRELRITSQRVNLFEKIKIPQAEEAIRLIKIYLGDQMANAVGRSKIAKRKIQEQELAEVSA